jgi:hypothetical protein
LTVTRIIVAPPRHDLLIRVRWDGGSWYTGTTVAPDFSCSGSIARGWSSIAIRAEAQTISFATVEFHDCTSATPAAAIERTDGEDPCGVPELGHGCWSAVSGRGLVLVDQAAEDRSTSDPAADRLGDGRFRTWRPQLQCSMRPMPVVVHRIPGKHAAQVSFPEDQHPVGDLGSDGQHEAFGEAVRPRLSG